MTQRHKDKAMNKKQRKKEKKMKGTRTENFKKAKAEMLARLGKPDSKNH